MVQIDPEAKSVLHLGAGQESFLIRAGGEVDLLPSGSPPLGLLEELAVEPASLPLQTGDVLLLTSDGLFDAAAQSDGRIGRERCLNWLVKNRDQAAETLLENLLKHVHDLAGTSQLPDDVSVVLVKRK